MLPTNATEADYAIIKNRFDNDWSKRFPWQRLHRMKNGRPALKTRLLAAKDKLLAGKDKLLAAKDKLLAAKDAAAAVPKLSIINLVISTLIDVTLVAHVVEHAKLCIKAC
ncbi:hypothetical protein CLOM_g7333 [Closterium sp. NIES-68]|nr:hypothetical protein CLOM_g7333 [Closterium sp. NIES-68]